MPSACARMQHALTTTTLSVLSTVHKRLRSRKRSYCSVSYKLTEKIAIEKDLAIICYRAFFFKGYKTLSGRLWYVVPQPSLAIVHVQLQTYTIANLQQSRL